MIVHLKKGEDDVAKLDIICSVYYPIIKECEIIDYDKLPFLRDKSVDPDKIKAEIKGLLMTWFSLRSIPNSRINLDNFIMNLFGMRYNECGRMYGFQNLAAMLAYYISAEDEYFLTPERHEFVYVGDVYTELPDLFLWEPADYKKIRDIKDKPDPELRKYLLTDPYVYKKLEPYKFEGCYPTMDFTIREERISYYDENKRKNIL